MAVSPSGRSPQFPYFDLEKATSQVAQLFASARGAFVRVGNAIEYLGYSSSSSGGRRTIAALIQFGLVEDRGSSEEREVRVTELGRRIVLEGRYGAVDYLNLLKEAALNPPLYRQIWDHWEGEIPAEAVIERFALIELGFSDASVKGFVEDFVSTIRFAKLDSVLRPPVVGSEHELDEPKPKEDPVAPLVEAPAREIGQIQKGDPSQVVLPVPLGDGATATLTIPRKLSALEYAILKSVIDGYLKSLERAIVKENPPE